MNINKFKEGDVITRTEPISGNGDRSYIGDKLVFIGADKGVICLIGIDIMDKFRAMKLETDWWSDGWDFFPSALWEKTIKKTEEMIKASEKLKVVK